jgi:hypothetical protein
MGTFKGRALLKNNLWQKYNNENVNLMAGVISGKREIFRSGNSGR